MVVADRAIAKLTKDRKEVKEDKVFQYKLIMRKLERGEYLKPINFEVR